jgi:hypothetical protein
MIYFAGFEVDALVSAKLSNEELEASTVPFTYETCVSIYFEGYSSV